MTKVKYYYNTKTCRYEVVKSSKRKYILYFLGFLLTSASMGTGIAKVYHEFVPSKEVSTLQAENQQLLARYQTLDKEIKEATVVLDNLQKRDNNLYRSMLEAEPIPLEMRKGGTGGAKAKKYEDLEASDMGHKALVASTLEKLDNIKRQMYIQTKSYDELVTLSQEKNKMLASIPAIQPLAKKDLVSFASPFGMRMHPILKEYRLHAGCDLTAPIGTPVHASGDGVIVKAEVAGGYGNMVEVDHGYGYTTRYAHLSKFKCRRGQKVKRGQLIGLVGSTGLSVAPHLHYEVRHKGTPIDPVNFFFNDITPEEYQHLIKISATPGGQSLGGGLSHDGHRH